PPPAFQQPLTSPGSVGSSRGSSVPGSPSSIVARMDNEVLGYKDLAAIPKDKAILDIERPDLMIYEPHFTYSLMEHVELPRSREPELNSAPGSLLPTPPVCSKGKAACSERASLPCSLALSFSDVYLPVFPWPLNLPLPPEMDKMELNIYKKPPIYKQKGEHGSQHGKHMIEDQIIESSKFPAAQPPDPNQPAKIETDYWPCPPSLAVVETEWRRRMASKKGEEEDEDLTEEMKNLRELQKQELSKVTSNLGKLILKEEMEKSLPIRRKTRSLPDRTPFHTCAWGWAQTRFALPLPKPRSPSPSLSLGWDPCYGDAYWDLLTVPLTRAGGSREPGAPLFQPSCSSPWVTQLLPCFLLQTAWG
uniref:Dematin actin binding protein n=1 Tax=Crocodylus porosus TaxID=8502 RepID=A0A7M4E245_CROPO